MEDTTTQPVVEDDLIRRRQAFIRKQRAAWARLHGSDSPGNSDRFVCGVLSWLENHFAWFDLRCSDDTTAQYELTVISVHQFKGNNLADVLADAVLELCKETKP